MENLKVRGYTGYTYYTNMCKIFELKRYLISKANPRLNSILQICINFYCSKKEKKEKEEKEKKKKKCIVHIHRITMLQRTNALRIRSK